MDVGKLIYKVETDSSGLVGGLTSAIGSITKTVAVGIGAMTTAASAAVSALAVKSVKAFGEIEQNLGGTEAVFGQFAQNVQRQADEAYKNMGLSANAYMATANKMGSLFQGSGIEQARSLELTSAAMQRAADVASVMGLETSAAMEAIAGAAKGNFTMMDNLGVAINATTLDAYAASLGMEKFWANASNAEKAELAIQLFMERTSQYAGNFARESQETISGSMGMLKASIADFMGDLANADRDISQSAGRVAQNASTVIKNIVPAVTTYAANLPKAIAAFMQATPEIIASVKQGAGEVVSAFMGSMREQFGGSGGGGLGAVAGVVSSVKDFAMNLIIKAAKTVADNAPRILEALSTSLTRGIARMSQFVNAGLEIAKSLADGVLKALPSIVNAALTAVTSFANFIIDNLDSIVDTGMNILFAVVRGIMRETPKIISAASDIVQNLIRKILSMLPNIIRTGFAMLKALLKEVPAILDEVMMAAGDIIGTLINELFANIPALFEIGYDLGVAIVNGLWNALTGGINRVANALNDFYEGVAAMFGDIGAMFGGDFTSPNSRAFLEGKDEWGSRNFAAPRGSADYYEGVLSRTRNVRSNNSSLFGNGYEVQGFWGLQTARDMYGKGAGNVLQNLLTPRDPFAAPAPQTVAAQTLEEILESIFATGISYEQMASVIPDYILPDFSNYNVATGTELSPVGTGYGTNAELALKKLEDTMSNLERSVDGIYKSVRGGINNIVNIKGQQIASITHRHNAELSAATGINR